MPLIDLDLFNPSGCETPPLPFSPEQIKVLKSVVDGEAFENPVAGVVNQVNSAAVAAANKLENLAFPLGNPDLSKFNNSQRLQLRGLSEKLEDVSSHISDFSQHADRLSGVTDVGNLGDLPGLAGLNSLASNINNVKNSIEQDTFGEDVVDHYSAMFSSILGPGSTLFEGANALIEGDVEALIGQLEDVSSHISDFSQHADRLSGVTDVGNLGDLPGLAGLNSLASNINNVKNSIEQDTFGEDVVDHYSAMFSSILGPGSTLFEGANALIEGDVEALIGQLEAFEEGDQFPSLTSISTSVTQIGEDIQNIIESDNDYALAAIDYLAKVSLGTSVLSMVEDPCFGQKLLQQVVKPDIKGLLNI